MLALSLLRRHPEYLAQGLACRGWATERIAATLAALQAAGDDDATLSALALTLPNLPDATVPEARVIRREWGAPTRETWMRPHWDILTDHGWLDAPRGTRIAGPRFTLLRGWGARLERALQNWMIDLHTTQHGYSEIAPPLLANTPTLQGTAHWPHFQDEMYAVGAADLWLNPTAEVPLVALHAGELLAAAHLPLAYVAGIASFRREAGSSGQATRGLLRLHQFQKVEMVQITTPEQANAAFAALTVQAEAILVALGIPFRTVDLPAPELSFAAARGRDIEAWFPGIGEWIEVASITDCGTFQARRAAMRYTPSQRGKPRYPHTLNASGLAVGRTLAALVENSQQPDGTIELPAILRPYLGQTSHVPPEIPR